MSAKIHYSFVVDGNPVFAYQAWHLARSLGRHCAAKPEEIHVQFTPAVPPDVVAIFATQGYPVHTIAPFGDGKWCNKLSQLPNLLDCDCERILLLDTDMIAVEDLRPFLSGDAVQGKIIDCCNPPLATLLELYRQAGGTRPPMLVVTDTRDGETLSGNANGGFYAIPKPLAERFSQAWRHWAQWLMAHDEPLRRDGMAGHIDQISAALAVGLFDIPFSPAPSNINYFLHFRGEHHYFDRSAPIALLHYHLSTMNVLGLIEPPFPLEEAESAAVAEANRLISGDFQNALFWNFRYEAFPERGSGIGSRGDNLVRKRMLLREQGVERSRSLLDVGCGDLEVLRELEIQNYLGLDLSQEALKKARLARPDWQFALLEGQPLEGREMVLCFEVLIHQSTRADYDRLIAFLANHTQKTLLVSGYENKDNPQHMVHFYEPLSVSLARTGRFESIRAIGGHTDVTVFRCEVGGQQETGRGSVVSRLFQTLARLRRKSPEPDGGPV